jgi:predicted transcriptional regulator
MNDTLPDDFGMSRRSDPQSSRDAARMVVPVLNEIQAMVLSEMRRAGDNGLTDYELDAIFDCRKSTYRSRRAELVEKGMIKDSGTRRENDGTNRTVWIAA